MKMGFLRYFFGHACSKTAFPARSTVSSAQSWPMQDSARKRCGKWIRMIGLQPWSKPGWIPMTSSTWPADPQKTALTTAITTSAHTSTTGRA